MPGSITDFLAEFSRWGVSRTSHFDVWIAPLRIVNGQSKLPTNMLTFRCEAAEIPGRQIVSADIKIGQHPIYKTPFQTVFQETTLTFIETADMDIRVFFEDWMNAVIDGKTFTLGYPDSYMQDITINQYDVVSAKEDTLINGISSATKYIKNESGKTVAVESSTNLKRVLQCKLIDAFPTNVNQMTTQWNDDSLHRLQVTFFYRSYQLIQTAVRPDPVVSPTSRVDDNIQVTQNFSGAE